MDKNSKWINEQRILRTIKALENNNMNGYLVNNKEELIDKIEELMQGKSTIACGGSMTLSELGVRDYLRNSSYTVYDREQEGLTKEQITDAGKKAFISDCYITSSNAITEDGYIYNVDGGGNRVAAILYGPDKVIIVAGVNKIVSNVEEAVQRVKKYTAPANARRLCFDTPCAKIGQCMDCRSAGRICNEFTLIKRQGKKNRIHVIFINEQFGY